jgi:hypothetical protein
MRVHRFLRSLIAAIPPFLLVATGLPRGMHAIEPTPTHVTAEALPAGYHWPTSASTIVTSSFGEYRDGHFHAGIDVSTQDGIGYPVFAASDGYVARIRISATGYGKMLYVRHADEYTSTYAHLDRFAGSVAERARREQLRLGRFTVDIECTPTELPVHNGDLIGYTGDTGTGSAHLHFEIFDPHSTPVNPLLAPGYHVVDEIPPIIRAIAVSPVGSESTVDGEPSVRTYKARPLGRGRYYIRETIRVTGSAGFCIDARDRAEGTWFLRGVYQHRLIIDDTLRFTVRLDRLPADAPQQIYLYYHDGLLRARRGRFEKLYRDEPSMLPFTIPATTGAGVLPRNISADGPHRFRIESEDINGNRATVQGTISFRAIPPSSVGNRPEALPGTHHGSPAALRNSTYLLAPGMRGTYRFLDGMATVDFDSTSVFGPMLLSVERNGSSEDAGVTLMPDGAILRTGITLTLHPPRLTPSSALYFRGRGSGWSLLPGQERTANGDLRARVTRMLGDVTVKDDDTPPSISRLTIAPAGSRKPRIAFRFGDNLSGVEYDELKMYIDGSAVIPEIDGEYHRTVCQVTDPLERGPHQLTIQLKDRMGNTQRLERRFIVR